MINGLSRVLMVLGAISTFQGLMSLPALFNPDFWAFVNAESVAIYLFYSIGPLIAGAAMIFGGWKASKSNKAQAEAQLAKEKVTTGNASKPSFGITFMLIGAAIAFSPLLIAMANTAPGHNWMSEGDSQSGGAAIWLMMFTLPVGGIIGIYGLVKLIQSGRNGSSASGADASEVENADQEVHEQPTKSTRTTGAVLALAGAAFFGSQGLLMLTMSQWAPGMAIQAIFYVAIGAALAFFGWRSISNKRK